MSDDNVPALYFHSKRPEWGLAIIAWQSQGKRRYQFQDGQMRTFKKGFWHLMEEADKPLDITMRVAQELESKLDMTLARGSESRSASRTGTPLVRFEDQVKVFTNLHPGGFQDEKYIDQVRGTEGGSRRKRHRDSAIADAQKRLGKDRLDELIAAGEHATVHAEAVKVLAATNLARPRDRRPLEDLEEADKADFAQTLRDLLHAEETSFFDRFTRFVAVLDRLDDDEPTWILVTALGALVHPEEHVCVKPSVFRHQARWMAPNLEYQREPNATLYERFRKMAQGVHAALIKAGLEPRDMLDVFEFIWLTLRPKARKLMKEIVQKESAKLVDTDAA